MNLTNEFNGFPGFEEGWPKVLTWCRSSMGSAEKIVEQGFQRVLHRAQTNEQTKGRATADGITALLMTAAHHQMRGRCSTSISVGRIAYLRAKKDSSFGDLTSKAISNLGVMFADIGEHTSALACHIVREAYCRGVGDEIHAAGALANIGCDFLCMGQLNSAEKHLNRAVASLNPADPVQRQYARSARFNLVHCSLYRERADASVEELEKILSLGAEGESGHGQYHMRLGQSILVRAWAMQGEFSKADVALTTLEQWIGAKPTIRDKALLAVAEGELNVARGALTQGIASLKSALDLPHDSKYAYHDTLTSLIKANQLAGNTEEARRLFELFHGSMVVASQKRITTVVASLGTEREYRSHRQILPLTQQRMSSQADSLFDVSELALFAGREREALYRQAVYTEMYEDETGHHCYRVGELAVRFAEYLSIFSDTRDELRFAAEIHDIGKDYLPRHLLAKKDSLTLEEFEIVKRHTVHGYIFLMRFDDPVIRFAAKVVLHHHENWNGTGYPNRLKGDEIPLAARVVTLCDVYDALTHKRAYKSAWTHEQAIAEIASLAHEKFDPTLCGYFVKMMNQLCALHGDRLSGVLSDGAQHTAFAQVQKGVEALGRVH